MRGLRHWQQDRAGAVVVITALCMAMIVALMALAIDVGHVYTQARKLQGMADVAALAAASDLERADRAARATVTANGWENVGTETRTGHYDISAGTDAASRFLTAAPSRPVNAAQVVLTAEAPLFFGKLVLGKDSVTIRRAATASQVRLAAFSIGSGLLSLDGGIVNALLSGLTGSKISLSVMDYKALASADVDLLSFVKALHTKVGVDVARPGEVLSAEIGMGEALSVLADQVSVSAAGPIRVLAATNIKDTKIRLNDLISVDARAPGALGGMSTGADQILSAMLALANENRQVELDVGAAVPGLASVKVWLAIGERPNNSPWMAVTGSGETIVRTAQTRLYVEASVKDAGGLLSGLNSLLSGLLGGLFGGKPSAELITLPVLVELASAEARLSDIGCAPDPAGRSVTLELRPSVGRVVIGKIDTANLKDFRKALKIDPAMLVNLAGIAVTARSEIKLGGEAWQKQTFTAADIANRTTKTAKTNDLVGALASSLVERMSLSVAGIDLGLVTAVLGKILGVVAGLLDPLLNQLLGLLGVGLGTVDAQVNGVRCAGAVLVA